jgi:hypothetical protein
MNLATDRLITAILLILVGVGQITTFLNFHPGVLLICVGFWYIMESR